MSTASISIGGMHIGKQQTDTKQKKHSPSSLATAFHALILGDFSGTQNHTASLKPKVIDRDNFDASLLAISPSLTLHPTNDRNNAITLTFSELENFEPDHLYESLDIFAELRNLRRKLANNSTFETAAKEMSQWHIAKEKKVQKITPSPTYEPASNENLLDTLLNETAHRQEKNTLDEGQNIAQSLIQQVVAPYIIPGTHPQKAEYLSTLDEAISGLMNTLLHHRDFQALESSWRNLYATVKKIKTDSKLKIYFTDISKSSLFNDTDTPDISNSTAYKNLIEPYTDITGSIPWAVIVGDYYFGDTAQDILLLERLGLLAQRSNTTFIAAAKSELVNCLSLNKTPDANDWNHAREDVYIQAWQTLRNSPQANNIALTFPRTLTRLPYGDKTTSVESFSFEEMKGSEHDNYLWGNSAYSVLVLLAESFSTSGWSFTPGQNNAMSNLPAHSFELDDDVELKPCAEIYLTEKGGEKALENGLLPIWSILRSDSTRVGPFSSLHSSNQRIAGKWQC